MVMLISLVSLVKLLLLFYARNGDSVVLLV